MNKQRNDKQINTNNQEYLFNLALKNTKACWTLCNQKNHAKNTLNRSENKCMRHCFENYKKSLDILFPAVAH